MYATLEEARLAGAAGDDARVTAALGRARELIDRYTRAWWEPTVAVVASRVDRGGFAPVPYVVQSIDSVTPVASGVPLPAGSWRVLSSTVEGERDGILLPVGGSDPLVLGAEPWAGGYGGLLDRVGRRVRIGGTFGAAAVPEEVASSAARLAAWLTLTGGAVGPAVPDVDTEGNALTITVDADRPVAVGRTTGRDAEDAALAHLLPDPNRVRVS